MTLTLKTWIKQTAFSHGFNAIGFAPSQLPKIHGENLQAFVSAGHHGDMAWMEERVFQRSSPHQLWPEAKSAILLAHNYGPSENPLKALENKHIGAISAYAQNLDYHDVIKKKLKAFARELVQHHPCEVKVFVDTAPLMEKPLASLSGIGWQGKHTCIVSREYGSWLFLGVILTTLELPPDIPEANHCGKCTNCLDICPTQAFTKAGQIDARRCISYLTIEHKSIIPLEFRKAMGNRIYGCDDCLAICPWNKFAQTAGETAYHARESLRAPLLAELLTLTDESFREMFRKSPIKRIGRDRFIRNVLVAAGNSGNVALLPLLSHLLTDNSELVRGMAVWAYAELANKHDFFTQYDVLIRSESSIMVQKEWELALKKL